MNGVRAYIEDIMYGRRKAGPVKCILTLLSVLYRFIIALRGLLYAVGIFRKKRLPRKVISIGNITLGGTGKTPAVMEIAELIRRNGGYPAVISRGYGRRSASPVLAVSDGKTVLVDSWDGGDEPVLMASRLSGVPVVVGRDRYMAGLFAIQAFGADVIILDDGFQHLRLKRDLDIILIDAGDPFGNGKLFPAGILREPVSALRRADAIVITRVEGRETGLKTALSKITKARIFTSRHEPMDIIDIKTGEVKPLSALQGISLLAFSGIGRPEHFIHLLRSLGADIRYQTSYPDHYEYTRDDMADIFQMAADRAAVMIITTEKDAVRIRPMNLDGVWALRIRLKIIEQEDWERMILGMAQGGSKPSSVRR